MKPVDRVLNALAECGLLLNQDKEAPNVVTLVTGESLCDSWWGHPQAREIFAALTALAGNPDVLFAKLLYGKVTLVHRRLWPPFLAVASARDGWQMRGLPVAARSLLGAVDRTGFARATGSAVKVLEQHLLVHTEEVHTKSGRHEMLLEPWPAWSRRIGCKPFRALRKAYDSLESATRDLGVPLTALPWPSSRGTSI